MSFQYNVKNKFDFESLYHNIRTGENLNSFQFKQNRHNHEKL